MHFQGYTQQLSMLMPSYRRIPMLQTGAPYQTPVHHIPENQYTSHHTPDTSTPDIYTATT